ncbi:DUF3429 domain-containing protein [Halomonas sp. TD01]|uniref:DUF3429 domain-containing protein n=1 Tax=Halomonas sp. TD01 TaxID=999141 RepID=UPI000214EE8A|nr:DUF3429 domain-containing protein [Halomonas sp. TD01]EGP21317.1 hypothetical protein GME_02154 [Halomonas sp. TD01]CAH1043862.1 hypothetical protein HPTD01_2340 [Halomonas sp. TD01]
MSELSNDRHVAWLLGLAGLIPFIAGGLFAWWAPSVWQVTAVYGFSYYSAVILSFLGGVHWGAALQVPRPGNRRRLIIAMVPSLIAWPALLFDVVTGLWVLVAGFILIGGYDLSRDGREGFPHWYLKLRCVLTGVVVAFHLIVLLRLGG